MMNKFAKVSKVIFYFCLLLLLLACNSQQSNAQLKSLSFIKSDKSETIPIEVEIANTKEKVEIGLMYRKSMPENQGMFFIFPEELPRTFWMKNTYIPLDMIFISSQLEVVKIVENATPLTESPRESIKPAKYVLELNAGIAKKLGIDENSKLKFDSLQDLSLDK